MRDILRRFSMVSEGPAAASPSLAPPEGRRKPVVCPSCAGSGLQRTRTCTRCRGAGRIAANARHKSTKPHHESKAPQGSSESLFTHYLDWFRQAPNDLALEHRVRQAEGRYVAITGKGRMDVVDSDHRRAEAAGAFGDDGAAMEEAQAQRVLAEYVGMTALDAALCEGDERLESWIEKVRRIGGYDEQGNPRPRWTRWSDETKREQVAELERRGFSIRQAADHLKVSKSTVDRFWPERARA